MTHMVHLDIEQLPDGMLLTVKEVTALLRRSRSTLWRDIKNGRLAQPIRINGYSVRWRVGDIRKFLGTQ